ncbi:hypothetical protein TOPH_00908 [Tolypocladium ophioglossoides CBS 100239]|uniref:Uncharacterized protein n=1 Tax=Tolypocladium ophioglossoides (strain CBS 100239) TaxID=1163406 RepID=A0A0L0NJY4_TOLOC|nr:hypothetical protein TOPH_00908 [Tolypocladium ophioglossoides CBS 100239]
MTLNSRHPLFGLLFLLLSTTAVLANVEKVIFTGPVPANIPLAKPALSDLKLHALTPESSSVRTNLNRVFPADKGNAAQGRPAWLLLDGLIEGQRYELRVCWAAIGHLGSCFPIQEPTSFTLDVYELDTVWQTPELIQSLTEYVTSRQADPAVDRQDFKAHKPPSDDLGERKTSVLLLHVRAAADYFTDDAELMQNPPPGLVDLILDPFLYNVVPRSLIPTAGYLVLVGAVTWFVARWIASSLQSVASSPESQAKKQD